ncbi:hypothetical protein [Haloarcula laminariae]|uniref:hypothetical protein n=1 Tax=Haloarcula laminariae TaxID=2961577 RepID=UPI0021C9F65B|nr:hypothetical protein [Halomicroarcula laminariae]
MTNQAYLNRRTVLKLASGSVFATAGFEHTGSASAQTAASVTLNDQESSGDSIVIESLQTDTAARLYISPVDGDTDTRLYKELELDAGASFTDRTIEPDVPIEQSATVSAVIQAGENYDEVVADDTALIGVGESGAAARASQVRGGELEIVDPDPDAGFHHPYALYRPDTQQDTARPLFVEPHNSRPAASPGELTDQLSQEAEGSLQPAIELSLPGIVAGFPRTPDDGGDYVQSLALEMLDTETKREDIATDAFPADTLHRVDRQLMRMVEDAKERLSDESYAVTDGIHMNGFSASGSFSSRFAFLHPNQVQSISVGGGGARPLPLNSMDGTTLPYPLGTADYQEWTGGSFDRDAWTAIDQYIHVGQEDQPLPETDQRSYYPISPRYQDRAEEIYGQNRVTERFPVTQSRYEEAGANATFNIYQGVGHTITSEIIRDITAFHRRTSNAQHALFEMTLQRSADRATVGNPVTVTVEVQNRVATTATVTPTFAVDGTEMDTAERDIAPNGTAELTFDHTFDEPGSYTLSINGRTVGAGPVTVTESTPTERATSESGPGFGVGTALAGIAGLSYSLINQREN